VLAVWEYICAYSVGFRSSSSLLYQFLLSNGYIFRHLIGVRSGKERATTSLPCGIHLSFQISTPKMVPLARPRFLKPRRLRKSHPSPRPRPHRDNHVQNIQHSISSHLIGRWKTLAWRERQVAMAFNRMNWATKMDAWE